MVGSVDTPRTLTLPYAGGKNAAHSTQLAAPHTTLQPTHQRPTRGLSTSSHAAAQYSAGRPAAWRSTICVFDAKSQRRAIRSAWIACGARAGARNGEGAAAREEGEDEGKEIERLRRGRLDKDVLTLGLVCKEVIDFAGCAVVGNDGEALVVHVEDEVLALNVCYCRRADTSRKMVRTMTAKPMRPISPL